MPGPLRIFLSSQQAVQRHAVPAYAFWAEYFRGSFAEAGHECLEAPACDWAGGLLPTEQLAVNGWAERTWTTAIEFLRREHARQPIDFFLGYLFPQQVLPAAVAEIRALGIPCVNFFCDNVREFRHVPAAYRGFDLHWVPEHDAVALYRRAGLPLLNAPMACWVPPAQRGPAVAETRPVTFVGTRDQPRERLFAEALQCGLQCELRGPGWESAATAPAPPPPRATNPATLVRRQYEFARQHGWSALARKYAGAIKPPVPVQFDFSPYARPAVFGDAYWSAIREATVCLGVNRYPSPRHSAEKPRTYSRLRDIEAPMSGACYLTEWAPGLEELYEVGHEIEAYRDPAELAEKARALAADPARRARLRAAGQRRALAEHSIGNTIERISKALGLARG